ncbi:MAG: lipopolysaccharide biosynthesis protein [Erysipelotrichaceae bacterium]|jgi:O-antigen/teichoic acid export membrane protein|uniref:Lipopolysaccharide biosynthesis protein n=1 Tax=Grylomicrobium aquisgranensis TaxID=2926318 RepID=A0AB35U8W8_9FIRM|nr:lipopolysaccharide biosynthesis protein [Erysipelotrichaceae bacterium]MCH4044078.1 lipopolysaccharide biosynthesis protein [Erysipelotrichaceae bacterium]MCH4121293.1 lipopolysaccharide biosynthesis protein [Erysipelotrichaceae bacterium]MDX8419939.1 lipopolysaccharide biosynthesis protein [Stecheria sp. CLA-KB-P133]
MDDRKQMTKNIAWNTFGSVFYSACQWLITVLVVHLSSYESAGYLSLAMTTSSSFSAISLYSMRNFQVSDVKGEYNCNEYVGSRIDTCILAFVCCAIVSVWGNSSYQALCIIAYMIIRIAEAIVDVLHGENQKFQRYDYIGKSYIFRGLLTIVSFVVGLLTTKNLLITLFFMAALNLLSAFIYDWKKTSQLEHIQPVLFSKKIKKLLLTCLPIVIFSFLLSLENLIPKNVLQQILGTEELGVYSSIASPTLVVQVFASVAFNPLLPGLSKLYDEKKYSHFSKNMRKVYLGFAGLCLIVTVGALLLGRWGLSLLFGKSILARYDLFLPIVWVTILTAIIWIMSSIIVAIRQIKWLLIGMIADFLLCLLIVYPIINGLGSNGVSFVQIISYSIYIVYMILLCEATIAKQKKKELKREEL